ncbi:MAG: glutathione S-transferase family protein [Pseudomonadota bacterium]
MLEIYAIPVSLYCAKTRILLRHKGLSWTEIEPPGGYGSDIYRAVVPAGNLPALRAGDLMVTDSEAIAEYLDDAYPDPPAMPGTAAERAIVRSRSRFHDTRLEPAVRALFPYLPGREPLSAEVVESHSLKISAFLEDLLLLLEDDPTAGEELRLGDCGYPITFAWLDELTPRMGLELKWPEKVIAYRWRLQNLPAVSAELASYKPRLTEFLDG